MSATLIRQAQTDILQVVYPVGAMYISVVSTDPNTLFGFGTWSLFGVGRTLVGIDSGDTDFDTVEETRGEKTHTLNDTEMPAHTHTADPGVATSGNNSVGHTHGINQYTSLPSCGTGSNQSGVWRNTTTANSGNASADHTHTLDIAQFNSATTGSATGHNNVQPYVVVSVWKRTA